jgi:succinoglycan biosynthesis protein ExoU
MAVPNHSTVHRVIDKAGRGPLATSVDVLIAARDRSDTIERAVASALAEPEVSTVIVVDDGSADDTALMARRCDPGGGRLIVERLSSSVGPSAARNIAMEIAKSPWLAILDGDDFFLPGRVQNLLVKSDGWDFIADDQLQSLEDHPDCDLPRRVFLDQSFEPQPINLTQFVLGNITRKDRSRQEFGFIKPLIRRSFLGAHSLRYDESLRLGEDYAFYTRALAAGARFLLVPIAGYVSTLRASSLSARHSKQDLERLRDSDCELIANTKLTPRERRAVIAHYWNVDCRVQWLAVIEAFKARNIGNFLAPFGRSPRVSAYILRCLTRELAERSTRRWASR